MSEKPTSSGFLSDVGAAHDGVAAVTGPPRDPSLRPDDALLGGLLLLGQIPAELRPRIQPDLFEHARRPVARALLAVADRLGACPPAAVAEELARHGAGIGPTLSLRDLYAAAAMPDELDVFLRLLEERRVPAEPGLESPEWPSLASDALHGLAGKIVQAIAPYTEADPVAVLGHTLVAFGNVIGRAPHFRVEYTRHFLNLFVAVVGETAKGRKGQSWSTPRFMFGQVDERWAARRVTEGLSSGEGLVYHVRDSRMEQQPIRKGGRVEDYQEVVVDGGVQDKRLLLVEQEFAQPLKVMKREGNILSATLRQAWDTGDLHPLTKHNPIAATGAHISIVGHITRNELLAHLGEVEQANGFANRFIWLLVRRSKVIPNPTGVPEEVLRPLTEALLQAVGFAQAARELKRDPEAEAIWAGVYPALSEGKPGLLGAIIARAEAQVMRLACLYALLDHSTLVRPAHLRAALALWDYADASARRIFGTRLGDPVADRILEALRATPDGLGKTEIWGLFDRHCSRDQIDQALDYLHRLGLAEQTARETAGRPRTIWTAKKAN